MVITLVAVFMLFVIGAMAALSIDVVAIYTARSEAQLAADAGALAGARLLANSGATSDTTGNALTSVGTPGGSVETISTHVAQQNKVGGITPTVTVAIGKNIPPSNPTVTVSVKVNTLPTFFARIWGRTTYEMDATAIAEVYNPSYGTNGTTIPVAPICVKPWLLPNISPDPSPANPQIFDTTSGAILDTTLLGWTTNPPRRLRSICSTANGGTANCLPASANAPTPWHYYPGTTDPATGSFKAPSATACAGCAPFDSYELSIAGCVQTPISCYSSAPPVPQIINIDTSSVPTDAETATAVNVLIHAITGSGDSVDTSNPPNPPFEFVAGTGNPIPGLAGNVDMVSDSLVTVPVIDTSTWPPPTYPQVQIIGFVQLFLSYAGNPVPATGHINTEVINLVGCGTSASGTPITGNGASPVSVRLISRLGG